MCVMQWLLTHAIVNSGFVHSQGGGQQRIIMTQRNAHATEGRSDVVRQVALPSYRTSAASTRADKLGRPGPALNHDHCSRTWLHS